MSKRLYQQIETLWDYLQLHQQPNVADLILVLGSNDVRVAEHAAKLYHQALPLMYCFLVALAVLLKGYLTTMRRRLLQRSPKMLVSLNTRFCLRHNRPIVVKIYISAISYWYNKLGLPNASYWCKNLIWNVALMRHLCNSGQNRSKVCRLPHPQAVFLTI